MLHLTKLAVGIHDLQHLRTVQTERLKREKRLRHRTRNFPRRSDEILSGGSMFWVIAGFMLARQSILDIIEDRWPDGSLCTGLILDPNLIPVLARPTKPFQGWRYLNPADAPPDRNAAPPSRGVEMLPPTLCRELRELCLI
jgi:hypothetical protein